MGRKVSSSMPNPGPYLTPTTVFSTKPGIDINGVDALQGFPKPPTSLISAAATICAS